MEKAISATVVTIGDELLIGQVVDTNTTYIASCLNDSGIVLQESVSVHDDAEQILASLRQAIHASDIVLLTGGLGPTKDDITKAALARFFGAEFVEDARVKQHVETLYSARPDVLNRLTRTQWLVPDNAEILENRVGSAPLMLWQYSDDGRPVVVVSMPGVPYEMQIAMQEQIMPRLRQLFSDRLPAIVHRNALVYGLAESVIELKIKEWEDALPAAIHLAYLPKDGIVRLRLSSYGEATAEQVERQFETLVNLLSENVIATEDLPLEVLVGKELRRLNATVSTAESCTGGKLAVLLNRHSGSSEFYMGSVVAYDNSVKQQVLGVSEQCLSEHGAVSEPTVRQMAQGVRRLLHTDYAIATSGVAGPTGGTPDKPVGTVWVAVATPNETVAQLLHLGTLREKNTDRATVAALVMLLKILRKS